VGSSSAAEPFRRKDGSWGIAVYSHGIREAFGEFSSRDEALDWIDKNRGLPDDPLLRLDINGLRRTRRSSNRPLQS